MSTTTTTATATSPPLIPHQASNFEADIQNTTRKNMNLKKKDPLPITGSYSLTSETFVVDMNDQRI